MSPRPASCPRSAPRRRHSTTPSAARLASSSYRAGLDASWEPDVFGANRSALQAAEAGARASAASLGDVQVSIAAEVALAYITLRGTQARLAIANDNLASQLEILQITQWRLQAGLVTSLEAEQARSGTEQTRAQLPLLQTSIEQAIHALAVLTGRPPAALSAELAAPRPVPQAADDLALASLPRRCASGPTCVPRNTGWRRPWRAWRRPKPRACRPSGSAARWA